jgi:SAM-dependent methyltransferase
MPSPDSARDASPRFVEPLAESAPIALRESRRLCRSDPATGEGCADYHGAWQYLRLLGIVGSAANDAAFFGEALAPLAREGRFPRVLVSGTADYCLPAQLLAIYAEAHARLDLTVLDVCETPLFLTRWYAERVSVGIETHAGDVVDYAPRQAFDMIATHCFFGRIAPDRRDAAVAAWYRLLRPGGRLVTVLNRIRPGAPPTPVRSTEPQTQLLVERALAAADRIGPSLGLDRESLISLVRRFAAGNATYPLTSVEEVRRLFEANGFVLERFDVDAPVAGGLDWRASGPAAVMAFPYGKVVATRPV